MLRLYIEDDAGNVRIVPLGGDVVTIGRAPDNVLVLPDRNVSRHHARIRSADGRVFLSDTGARYGIRIDGGRLANEVEIRPGDVFQVGDFHMKVMAPDSALAEAAPEVRDDATRPVAAMDEPPVAVAETPTSPGTDVGMMTLQEMEEVARLGWRSDFYDEDEPTSRKKAAGRILLLLALVVVAGGLAFAYYKLYVAEDEFLVPPRTFQPASAVPESPKPAPVAAPAPAPAPASAPAPAAAPRAPEPVPATPEPAKASPAPKTAEPAAPAARPAERAVRDAAPAPAPKPAPVAAPAPAPAAPAGDADVAARIDDEIAAGNLAEADRLLAQCQGKGCFRRAKGLGDAWQSRGDNDRAIKAYKRAMSMTQDPTTRERIARTIQALGGSAE